MKKIYSYVLMAAMLLIGTSAWATTRTASSAEELKAAWQATEDGDVIQLTNDVTFTQTLWLGTSKMDDPSKSITLDLNGWTLENKAKIRDMFLITHGELNIITSVAGGQIIQDGPIGRNSTSGKNTPCNEQLFLVTGSTYKNVNPKTATEGYYSHLVIGAGVTVEAKKQNAIVIDEIANQQLYAAKVTDYYDDAPLVATAGVSVPNSRTAPYSTKAYTYVYTNSSNKDVYGTKGLANGVRIDIYGNVKAEKYAFKANGNLGSPSGMLLNNVKYDKTKDGSQNSPITIEDAPGSNTYEIQSTDIDYSPFIRIYGSADLRVPASNDKSKKPVAVYCSGYARWLIEGTCVGSTAVYVKSGEIEINDATIQSNYTGDYVPASATNSGVTASGSAIVIESNAAYSGDIDVTVSGDSKVTATNGYAIDEAVTSADETEVNAITIAGGTFEGGNVGTSENPEQGTIQISDKTPAQETTITVVGGEINGEVAVGNEGDLDDIVDTSNSYVTAVTDPESGKTTLVVSTGSAPVPVGDAFDVDNFTEGDIDLSDGELSNKNQSFDSETVTSITVGTLKINPADDPVTLTITQGHTIKADKVILGYKGQIIVEAGASLIVTGDQGITAPVATNIILKASETDQAVFLFKPTVSSNRHPNATVQLSTKAHKTGESEFVYERFAIPTNDGSTTTYNALSLDTVTIYGSNKTVGAGGLFEQGLYGWGGSDWEAVDNWKDLKSFYGYQLTNSSKFGNVVYTFQGNLVGNTPQSFTFTDAGFGFFGNSYTGDINILKLFEGFDATMQKCVWVYDPYTDSFKSVTQGSYGSVKYGTRANSHGFITDIRSMQAFIMNTFAEGLSNAGVDYANAIWGNPKYGIAPSSAPTRLSATNDDHITIYVATESSEDEVTIVRSNEYSDAFDNGVDANKWMNEGKMNLYVETNIGTMSNVATDEIDEMIISFQSGKETNYMLGFDNLRGEEYYIRDIMTGEEILMKEGVTYNFTQEANTIIPARFQIATIAKVVTGVEDNQNAPVMQKVMRNGQLYILRDNEWFNVDGRQVK